MAWIRLEDGAVWFPFLFVSVFKALSPNVPLNYHLCGLGASVCKFPFKHSHWNSFEAVELCKCYINIFSRNYRHLHGLVEIALSEGEKKYQKWRYTMKWKSSSVLYLFSFWNKSFWLLIYTSLKMVVKNRQTKDTERNNFILFLCYIRSFNFHLVCIWRFGQCTPFFTFANE